MKLSANSVNLNLGAQAAQDERDVDRVLAGDQSGFEPIVGRWKKTLVHLAYDYFHDRDRSEEMAQEAIFRAYRALGQWRKQAAFATWLFRLANNLYCSELRRGRALSTVALQDIPEQMGEMWQEARLDQEDRNRALRRAVLRLPAKVRDVLILYYFQEKSMSEAAQCLGLRTCTVKARLSRGRAILRGTLSIGSGQPDPGSNLDSIVDHPKN
jgi:RNA polymerase sigma-70 factor (ECF subfamily)